MNVDLDAIVAAVRPYSMVVDEGIRFTAQSAIEAVESDTFGVMVECGVWRGGCSLAMLLAQRLAFGRVMRQVIMFDSFAGMPPVGPEDGEAAAQWQQTTDAPAYYDNCRADRTGLERLFALFGMREGNDYKIVQGAFEETMIGRDRPKFIAMLRLDGDWYGSTKACIEGLAPRLSNGARVIVDDYFAWEGCKLAVDEWLASRPGIDLQAMPDQSAAYFRMPE